MKEQNFLSVCLPGHGGVPIAIGMKVQTKEGGGAELMLYLNA